MSAPYGNKNATKSKEFERKLRAACEQDEWKRLRQGFEVLLDKAAAGDLWCMTFVRDTLDGKPAQSLVASDADGQPLQIGLIAYHPSQLRTPETAKLEDLSGVRDHQTH
jgi:hypothetical protein